MTREIPGRFAPLEEKRLLVTGAAGFIGGALFERLAGYGLDVAGTVLEPAEAETIRDRGLRAEVLDLADESPWDDLLSESTSSGTSPPASRRPSLAKATTTGSTTSEP